MSEEPTQENKPLSGLIAEMNRHIEELERIGAPDSSIVVAQCGRDKLIAQVCWNETISEPEEQ